MDLTKNNGLNLKSEASEFFLFEGEKDLQEILEHAEAIEKKIQVIGSGTNTTSNQGSGGKPGMAFKSGRPMGHSS